MDSRMVILVGIVLVGYFLLTRGLLAKTEGFSDPIPTGELRKPCKDTSVVNQYMEAPFVKRNILDVDDYEYNLVFQQEGDREISKGLYNKLQSQYPLDWSTQPPSSAHFQAGLQRLKESFTGSPVQEGINPYTEVSGDALTPSDTSLAQMEERKLLQLYQPSKTGELTTYQLDDADALVKRIYAAKGLVPEVIKKDGNIYEVIGTRRKDEKIVYEDENPPAQRAPVEEAGEGKITVPVTAVDVAAGLDPFFTPGSSTHLDRWDYTKFTPGLERMFAPTYPTVEWT